MLREHPRIVILTDDIYEHIYWAGKPFTSFAEACPELYDRTITVNGMSKGYAMSGWRIGYAAGPAARDQGDDEHPEPKHDERVHDLASRRARGARGRPELRRRDVRGVQASPRLRARALERDSGLRDACRRSARSIFSRTSKLRCEPSGRRTTSSSASSCSTMPASRSCRAPRSARRVICGCRSPRALDTLEDALGRMRRFIAS